jgi:hypothetical protein
MEDSEEFMPETPVRRLRPSDLSAERIFQAFLRRVKDMPHRLMWHSPTPPARRNAEFLLTYKNKHQGERCVIIGNGPSLRRMDLSLLKNEITFGMNRIYLLFQDMGFPTTYFVSVNDLVLSQFSSEISSLPMPKFINWNLRKYYWQPDKNLIYLKTNLGLKDRFRYDLLKPIFSGGTVTFVALQLAFYMGFAEVVLIGIDHSFKSKGVPNIMELRKEGVDRDHFHPQYFPEGSKWQLPDLYRSELAYLEAKKAFEGAGRSLIDATVGGKCDVFLKGDYDEIFQ